MTDITDDIAALEAAAKEAYAYTNMTMEVDPRDILELFARIQALLEERDALRAALGRILENEAPDRKTAEELGGYVLDDELRDEARAAIAKVTV